MDNKNLFWQSYIEIEQEVLKLLDYVFITDKNGSNSLDTYSRISADLLIRIGVQVETISAQIYNEIVKLMDPQTQQKYEIKNPKRAHFDSKYLSLINKTFQCGNVVVNITTSRVDLEKDSCLITPLSSYEKSEKGWFGIYQNVKHTYMDSLPLATIRTVLHACAALYLLNIYYRFMDNQEFKYSSKEKILNFDYNFGSNLFGVNKPKISQDPNDYNKIFKSDSPFVVSMDLFHYQNYQYKMAVQIKKWRDFLDKKITPNANEYNKFLLTLDKNGKPKYDRYLSYYVWYFKSVAPDTLPFDEREKRLLNLTEVKDYLRTNVALTLLPNSLTPGNFDDLVDVLGKIFGENLKNTFTKTAEDEALFTMFIYIDKSLW